MKRNISQLPSLDLRKGGIGRIDRRKYNKSLDFSIQSQSNIKVRKVLPHIPKILVGLPNVNIGIRRENRRVLDLIKPIFPLGSIKDSLQSESSVEEREEDMDLVYLGICKEILDELTESISSYTVLESFSEITHAALILHSNSIVHKLIKELVNETVNEVVIYSIDEVRNYELFQMSQKILNEFCESSLRLISLDCCIEIFSLKILNRVLDQLDFTSVVLSSIEEEVVFLKNLHLRIANEMIEEILQETWLEVLAEDVLTQEKIKENYKILPENVLKEINELFLKNKESSIGEEIYFDIIELYVSGIWLKNIVEYCAGGIEEPDEFILMPLVVFHGLRSQTLSFKIKYYDLSLIR